MVREAADAGRRQRLDRAGGDGIDANVLRSEIGGEIAHRRFERGFGHAHHVVVRKHARAAKIGERHDTPAAASFHQRLAPRASATSEYALMSSARRKAVARGLHERIRDVVAIGERDAVHEEVQPAVLLLNAREDRIDLASF